MSPAILSLLALILALGLSMTTRINVGWLGLAFAWLIGVYAAGLRPDVVMSGFPTSLFLTLVGVTLLFAIAETNGTLAALAGRTLALARGNARVVPVLFFFSACVLSSIGPGAVSTVALLAPLAMIMSDRASVPPFLTALMVANGANAGNLSPVSSVGVIANGAMAKAGLTGHEGRVWFANFVAHLLVAGIAYAWLVRSISKPSTRASHPEPHASRLEPRVSSPFTRQQTLTLTLVALWIAGVLILNLNLGLSAFAAAVILFIAGAADETAAVRRVPWAIVMMVSGVSVLIGVLEKTGGMELFTNLLAQIASARTVNGTIALITGAISTYSSTSGVVLPTFLPTVSTLVSKVGGGDPLAVALSINVGSSLVDVSPLSTLGALCVAAVADQSQARPLFRAMLIWGLSMILVGALFSQVFAPLLASAR